MMDLFAVVIFQYFALVPVSELKAARELERAQSNEGVFEQASPAALQKAEGLFVRTISGERSESLKQSWRSLGFVFESLGEVWQLREVRNTGKGWYLFREGPTTVDHAIQIPHGQFDLHTDEIGLKLFFEGRFRAGTWNSLHRYIHVENTDVHGDLAHLESSYLQAFTAAWARAQPLGNVFQFHGFSRKKRKEPNAARAGIILSDGSNQPKQKVKTMVQALRRARLGNVALFGRDTSELGGTINRQRHLLALRQHQGFIHVELSLTCREKMLRTKSFRKRFIDAILQ
jgi:hypothetical protein